MPVPLTPLKLQISLRVVKASHFQESSNLCNNSWGGVSETTWKTKSRHGFPVDRKVAEPFSVKPIGGNMNVSGNRELVWHAHFQPVWYGNAHAQHVWHSGLIFGAFGAMFDIKVERLKKEGYYGEVRNILVWNLFWSIIYVYIVMVFLGGYTI